MEKWIVIEEYFTDVETTKEYSGYFCSVVEALTIVILGSLCGLRNVSQIHQWAVSKRASEFLAKHFNIKRVPSNYWLLCLLKIVKTKSLNECFMNWAQTIIAAKADYLLNVKDNQPTNCVE